MPHALFGLQELSLFQNHLAPNETSKSTWDAYVSYCKNPSVVSVSSWDELGAAISKSVPSSVILLKASFWYGTTVMNQTIYERASLDSAIRMCPELLKINVPEGLTLHNVDCLASIPYFLSDMSTGRSKDHNTVELLLIDPDLYFGVM